MTAAARVIARHIERLFRRASPAFRAEVVAPFLADWRHEAGSLRSDDGVAAARLAFVYLSRLPALAVAALAERSRSMPDAHPPQLAARAFYVAAVALLLLVPRFVAEAKSPPSLVAVLAALLGLGLALVAVGLLLEARGRATGEVQTAGPEGGPTHA